MGTKTKQTNSYSTSFSFSDLKFPNYSQKPETTEEVTGRVYNLFRCLVCANSNGKIARLSDTEATKIITIIIMV